MRNGGGRAAQARGFGGDAGTDFHEELALDLDNAFVGREYFVFVFFSFRRREALGVDQSLFALVIRRREMHVGLRNFDVVTKNLVEANFQGTDTGAFAFALFHASDDLFAVLAEVTKFVEFGMEARTDHAGIGSESWWLIGDSAFEGFTNVSELVKFIVQSAKQRAAAGWGWRDEIS